MAKKRGIVIHCSDSPQGRGDNAATIDRWHKERGFKMIGYHYVILEDGTVEVGRKIGESGAHAIGYNHYIGICLIGRNTFTEAQFKRLALLVKNLMDSQDIDKEDVIGHYQVAAKTCPNFDVTKFKEDYNIR